MKKDKVYVTRTYQCGGYEVTLTFKPTEGEAIVQGYALVVDCGCGKKHTLTAGSLA